MVKNRSRPFLFLVLLTLAACGEMKRSFEYGLTTVSHLKQKLGEPLSVEQVPVEKGEILHYKNEQKFQVKGETVVAGFREPAGDERKVLYWRHRFRNCKTTENKSAASEIELACKTRGETVIFTDGSPYVSRIVEYEKK